MEKTIIDILGWAGTILYLVAYGLISAKKVEGDSWLYQGLNIVAGTFLIINTFYLRAYPSAGLNIAWVGIAIATLGRKAWTKASHD
ncbi:MAG TPA: hypothetical protein PKE35_03420 [Anaerolineales bacterium]|nr:hypothetical protein [Anaerolineales bacterium]HMV97449.1 hypothetical protein [Anaerolineales bacterium]HMX17690.1 hypothetical protein [Anaerolineales bacterium]HMX73273.1 hypothetical protein [Anaerolineales bacterium]HMZ42861.1 hypothetical protein [Anaerolineales bacterium]